MTYSINITVKSVFKAILVIVISAFIGYGIAQQEKRNLGQDNMLNYMAQVITDHDQRLYDLEHRR